MGPQSLGWRCAEAWAVDVFSLCTDGVCIIANACDVLREDKIYSRGLFSLHWIDSNLQCWPCFWLLWGAKLDKKLSDKIFQLPQLRQLCEWHAKYFNRNQVSSNSNFLFSLSVAGVGFFGERKYEKLLQTTSPCPYSVTCWLKPALWPCLEGQSRKCC